MTDDWRRDDYEKSCILATRWLRLKAIREGRLEPRPDDPEEMKISTANTGEG